MLLHFYKMNGAGNDFVVIDNRDLAHSLDKDQIEQLCDRHRGVGADGLLAVEVGQNRDCVEAAFPHLPLVWPATSGGEDWVFVIGRADLPGA